MNLQHEPPYLSAYHSEILFSALYTVTPTREEDLSSSTKLGASVTGTFTSS